MIRTKHVLGLMQQHSPQISLKCSIHLSFKRKNKICQNILDRPCPEGLNEESHLNNNLFLMFQTFRCTNPLWSVKNKMHRVLSATINILTKKSKNKKTLVNLRNQFDLEQIVNSNQNERTSVLISPSGMRPIVQYC